MDWNDIYGRHQIVRSLRTALSTGRLSHAYLFCGPEGVGKRTVAQVFAASLFCETSPASPCGNCSGCKKSRAGSHPDLHRILPEGKSLKIAQIREIKKSAYLRPREGRYQVFLLEQAETMTAEAANSLLKLLEEPPPATILILLAHSPSLLLPTVVSRCQLYQLPRLGTDELAQVLQAAGCRLSPEECRLAVSGAEGVPGRALQLAAEGRLGQYAEAASLLTELRGGSAVSSLADRLSEHQQLAAFLETMLAVLRDVMVLQATAERRLLAPATDAASLEKLLCWLSVSTAQKALRTVLQLQKDLQSPVNVRLALERALRTLKEVVGNADSNRYSL